MAARSRVARLLGICIVISLVIATSASAAIVFNVDSVLDQIDDDTSDGVCHTVANTCTLRAAIMQADTINLDVTINVPAGTYVLTIAPAAGEDDASGDLNLTFPVIGAPTISIVGAGRAATIVDANQLDRVFQVGDSRTAVLSGLTIRNGLVGNSEGGGIASNGILTLTDVIVSGNQALVGGGISSHGTLTIQDSTIVGNHATDGEGGGIRNNGIGALNIARSTIAGNTAVSGGGVWNDSVMFIINSTIAGNQATSYGGGIFSYATASLNANIYSATIAYNTAAEGTANFDRGGGVYLDTSGVDSNGFNVYNTILAMNTSGTLGGTDALNDCSGPTALKTHARNLFALTPSCTIAQISGSYTLLTPFASLGPLQDNGGPTQTIALVAGNNAIDGTIAGVGCLDSQSVAITLDQRGFTRGAGSACDVGAYEFGGTDFNKLFADGFEAP